MDLIWLAKQERVVGNVMDFRDWYRFSISNFCFVLLYLMVRQHSGIYFVTSKNKKTE